MSCCVFFGFQRESKKIVMSCIFLSGKREYKKIVLWCIFFAVDTCAVYSQFRQKITVR